MENEKTNFDIIIENEKLEMQLFLEEKGKKAFFELSQEEINELMNIKKKLNDSDYWSLRILELSFNESLLSLSSDILNELRTRRTVRISLNNNGELILNKIKGTITGTGEREKENIGIVESFDGVLWYKANPMGTPSFEKELKEGYEKLVISYNKDNGVLVGNDISFKTFQALGNSFFVYKQLNYKKLIGDFFNSYKLVPKTKTTVNN